MLRGLATRNQTYSDNKTYIENSKTISTSLTAGTGTIEPGNTENISAGYTVTVPAGFKIKNNVNLFQGIVLEDNNQNEFVWIAVNDAIYDGVTSIPTSSANSYLTYKPMAKKWSEDEYYYESIVYYFNGINSWVNNNNTGLGTPGYREPSLFTGSNLDGYTWKILSPLGTQFDANLANYSASAGFSSTSEMGVYLAKSYKNLINSVDTYGGFYIGRYEVTKNNDILTSKPNSTVYVQKNWYDMIKELDNTKNTSNPYYNIASVRSTMMWGSTWDQTLNFILKGDKQNYISTKKLGTSRLVINNSATDEEDIISNIYDLGSNAYEWTMESTDLSYRVARGGGYNIFYADKVSTRRNFKPTEAGSALSTRMVLYIQSTNDLTLPEVEIENIESKSNRIEVIADSEDKETGISNFKFYISEDGENWSEPHETILNNYTFTGLIQNKKYYIKVTSQDGAGNISNDAIAEIYTKELGAVASEKISVLQRLGTNTDGTIVLQADLEYENLGYYIEYQIAESEDLINQNSWIKSDQASGVKKGDKIFACLFDGINRTTDFWVYEVEDLEKFMYIDGSKNQYSENDILENGQLKEEFKGLTTYDTTIAYQDENGETAYIPAGFKVGVSDLVKYVNDGLVIEDKFGNQFVWVPVPDAIYKSGKTIPASLNAAKTNTLFYRPMAKAQKNDNSRFYESCIYYFAESDGEQYSYLGRGIGTTGMGATGYKEPCLVTGSTDYTWNVLPETQIGSAYDTVENYYRYFSFGSESGVDVFRSCTEFGHYMNQEYTNMIQSIDKHKGFYIARFETSAEENLPSDNTDASIVVQSKRGENPLYNQMWYKCYYYQDSNINSNNPFYGSQSVTCSMIWGAQWDAVLNWFLKDPRTKNFVTAKTRKP